MIKILVCPKERIRVTGHAHIDLTWLWTKDETVHLVAKGTFNYATWLMDKYPELVFAQSTAQLYEWIKKFYPRLYEKIKEKIKAGNWEIVGGSWSEHNANLLCGETLIRQYYYGKKFFKKEFGVNVELAWLPDCFGFNWGMPQVLRKVGIKYFLTSKLNWQIERMKKPIPFPYHLFKWEGIDGSIVLSYLTPGSYCQNIDPKYLRKQLDVLEEKHGISYLLVLFGHGDHGGGPNRDMIERVKKLNKQGDFPEIEFGKAIDYFKEMEREYGDRLPVFRDELYLKTHRGTFTTEARIKKFLRKTEVGLINLEKLSTIAYLLGADYPQAQIDEMWKKLLFITTHDTIDGTSCEQVYNDLYVDEIPYIRNNLRVLTEKALDYIVSRISLEKDDSIVNVVVFNTLSWERDGIVSISLKDIPFKKFEVRDPKNNEIPYQVDESREKLMFIAENVPGLGYSVYKIIESDKDHEFNTSLKVGEWFLENDHLRVEIDPLKGTIRRLYDKVNDREVFDGSKGGNILEIYEDMPPNAPSGEPAWNIYLGQKHVISNVKSIEVLEKGPIRGVIRVDLQYNDSRITEDIILYHDSEKVDVRLRVYWLEKYKFLKVSFPLSFKNDYATYEIPFGIIQRYRHDLKNSKMELEYPKRRWEEADTAKFEVPALRWAEVETPSKDYGVAFLNDSKYGFSYEKGGFKISLLRGPRRGYRKTPDSWADLSSDPLVGEHEIWYSIYPHKGTWKDVKMVHRGYEYNTPLITKIVSKGGEGESPSTYSFIEIKEGDVIVTAFKLDDEKNPILRIFEAYGKRQEVIVKTSVKIRDAWKTDMLEEDKYVNEKLMLVRDNELKVRMHPFEVATIKILQKS